MDHDSARLPFTKMQGVGNDFVVVDGRARVGMDWSGLSQEICDRRFGVGSDGLLVIDESRMADAMMRMFNPDGTPDVCGNGLRCVARYLADRRPGSAGTKGRRDAAADVSIATIAGVRQAAVRYAAGRCTVTVDMGVPQFAPERIPMRVSTERVVDYPIDAGGTTVEVTALSTGSTHAVLFTDHLPDDDEFLALSPAIENHPLFPDRTSVMWTAVGPGSRVRLRIWERGVGETLGCGTGACAAAVAARMHGGVEGPVLVESAGGELSVDWHEGSSMKLTGPAEYVFEGVYPLDPDGDAV